MSRRKKVGRAWVVAMDASRKSRHGEKDLDRMATYLIPIVVKTRKITERLEGWARPSLSRACTHTLGTACPHN